MAYTQREYTESDSVKKFREQMEAHAGLKPADYVSKWQPQIDSTMNDILNRKDFTYDVNADALYQQYKDRYVNLGQKAMMDTMGQAAQLTGGYGNSYAQMAGQQAYQGYLQGLTDKIPELHQLALARYNQQGQDLYSRYGLLSGQEQADFGRWQSGYNQWLSERDYLAGRFDTERGYDYGQYRDAVADDQWKANFDEDLRRYNLAHPAVSSSGGGGSYYSSGNPNPAPTEDPVKYTKQELQKIGDKVAQNGGNPMTAIGLAVQNGQYAGSSGNSVQDMHNIVTEKYLKNLKY